MAKAFITLANGYEALEAITLIGLLRRAGIDIISASLTTDTHVISTH